MWIVGDEEKGNLKELKLLDVGPTVTLVSFVADALGFRFFVTGSRLK